MTELFTYLLKNPSETTIMGGLIVVIILLIRNQQGQKKIATNHLHGLPDMAESLKRIETAITEIGKDISYIRGRINGKDS